jgi:hypothetical protein
MALFVQNGFNLLHLLINQIFWKQLLVHHLFYWDVVPEVFFDKQLYFLHDALLFLARASINR